MTSQDTLRSRRAIEALRCGVPNRSAVKALGCSQPQIEERFRSQLEKARTSLETGSMAPGMLVAGEFGAGKSHLLEYLQSVAIEQNFVCSKVVISKETPLFDIDKVFRAAIESAIVPGRRGRGLTEVANSLNLHSSRYKDFYLWLNQGGGGKLNGLFAATLFLFERMRNEEEMTRKIIRFWSGSRMSITEVKSKLKHLREAVSFKIDKAPTAREMAIQRFKFASRLIHAAGFSGWVVLIDEAELIGRYSVGQRARSYGEVARWMGELDDEQIPGLTAVMAITNDFSAAVLDGKNDIEKIPGKLRAKGAEAELRIASEAERGMKLIQNRSVALRAPDEASRESTHDRVKAIYAEAYGWMPPSADLSRSSTSTRMREHIKGWITEWDLRRFDKTYQPEIEVQSIQMQYLEDPNLMLATESDTMEEDE